MQLCYTVYLCTSVRQFIYYFSIYKFAIENPYTFGCIYGVVIDSMSIYFSIYKFAIDSKSIYLSVY